MNWFISARHLSRNHNHQRRRNQGDPWSRYGALPPLAAPSPAPAHRLVASQLGGLSHGPHHSRRQRLGADKCHELLYEAGIPNWARCCLPQRGESSQCHFMFGLCVTDTSYSVQEIDGSSLLLLHRQDVIGGLGLKLGPALKVFNQVKKLQTKRNLPTSINVNA